MIKMSDYLKVVEAKSKLSEIVLFIIDKFNISWAKSFIASCIFTLKDDDAVNIYETIKKVVEK
jgi:hypothetical protein